MILTIVLWQIKKHTDRTGDEVLLYINVLPPTPLKRNFLEKYQLIHDIITSTAKIPVKQKEEEEEEKVTSNGNSPRVCLHERVECTIDNIQHVF